MSGRATSEYKTARLCLTLGCLPSQLAGEKWGEIEHILAVMSADNERQEKEMRKAKSRK